MSLEDFLLELKGGGGSGNFGHGGRPGKRGGSTSKGSSGPSSSVSSQATTIIPTKIKVRKVLDKFNSQLDYGKTYTSSDTESVKKELTKSLKPMFSGLSPEQEKHVNGWIDSYSKALTFPKNEIPLDPSQFRRFKREMAEELTDYIHIWK